MTYGFEDRLNFSMGERRETDHETIQAMIGGCVSVENSTSAQDKLGVDYIARLRRGAEVLIDAKTRDRGCSRHWKDGEPEFALEVWSVMPGGEYATPREREKAGWTLCERKNVDLIFFKFHPDDTRKVYLVCYQLLRMAFRKNLRMWEERFKCGKQDSKTWESQCVFVPANVVYDAMRDVSISQLSA